MKRDFGEISTGEILRRAGVSRGALYHHFPSKVELFKAAYQQSERETLERLAGQAAAETRGDSVIDFLEAGCRAYLREASRPTEMQRIGLRQSRVVLGWEGWREAAADLGIAAIKGAVQAAVDTGELRSHNVEITTHLILAAMIEAALLIATDPDPQTALTRVEPELITLLEALRHT